MQLPEPHSSTFSGLINDIEKGRIKIPQFQRDFVWSVEKSANLIDSIVKGYPIGTFIFWKTKERLRAVRNIGGFDLPTSPAGDYVNFVLDGQQRLTSLFASLKGLGVARENGRIDDYSAMYIDLEAGEDEQIVIVDPEGREATSLIKVTDLLYGGFASLAGYPTGYHSKMDEYRKRISSYLFSIVTIKETPIDVATEVFTRINVGGKPLTLFEVMVAKTYDAEKDFDLSVKYDELIERLAIIGYDTLSDATVLQVVSMLLTKECTRKQILKLDKEEFINIWKPATEAIEKAAEYLRNYYRIPVSQLLPYNSLVVPFAYFFFHHQDRPTTSDKQKYLQDYFWRCSLSERFSSSVESKLAHDIKKIDRILKGELPQYNWSTDVSPEYIAENGWFSTSRSFVKAILCLYAYQQPKSFNDGSIVNISNAWLRQANSKNYHHFFPRAYLKKQGQEEANINHVANITIVDDFLNKREIGAKDPATYMLKFSDQNENLNATMKTHMIDDLEAFGIWNNDYERFFKLRIEAISKALKERIIVAEPDRELVSEEVITQEQQVMDAE